jgi:hypothetical protein
MTSTADDQEWEQIVKVWGTAYTFSRDPGQHPAEPHAARRNDGRGTLRAPTPARLLDAIKDDAAARPFAPPGTVNMTEEPQPAPPGEMSDEELAQHAAAVSAELSATPQGTPGRDAIIRQWAEIIAESQRRNAPHLADGKEPQQ